MSISKRDNYEFRQALTANRAAVSTTPGDTASRLGRAAQALRVQASWNEGAAQGSDPYNTVGTRTVGVS